MKQIFWVAFFFSFQTFASLTSSIPSTYLETEIPNSHLVNEKIIRGMAPKGEKDIQTLLNLGVERFLMFKIDTNGDIAKEIQILDSLGITSSNRLHLEFPWKDIVDYKPVCEMTIDALNFLKNSEIKNKKVFFHCTVGEDRTGYLAGLYKIYSGSQESLIDIFQDELCDKGYEAGNPNKIYSVVKKVRENLTPAFLAMANLIEQNAGKKLTKSMCSRLVIPKVNFKEFSCKKSKLLN
jgi:protein-tyrosine phosphatase